MKNKAQINIKKNKKYKGVEHCWFFYSVRKSKKNDIIQCLRKCEHTLEEDVGGMYDMQAS